MPTDRRDRLIAAIEQMNRNHADSIAEQRRANNELRRVSNSLFGLGKDMRRWFGERTRQPALPIDVPVEASKPSGVCTYEGCEWRGEGPDWFRHAHEVHGRELPDFLKERETA